ncbi:hypothetical protein OPU71_18630 [Niveibacterium sp. 24ML]|uniref:hypothetical protein n=1 Tax=Niveibacterium sp. 24ML TaxID=2985512 RepID=UPI00226E9F44|nr:hypothetical protein [Niveibacterium sp. 24ML]MCX9158143.1 hypothetical protein [Niveibacterium sp. 24ML]
MQVAVVQLFAHGVQCDRSAVKAEPAIEGELTLEPRGRSLVATLKRSSVGAGSYGSMALDALMPLLDPVLTGMNATSFVIEGIQRRHDEAGKLREERQAWWCRPLAPGTCGDRG